MQIPILYRDEHFCVVEKPPRLVTTAPDARVSLHALMRKELGNVECVHPSSRLDKGVSGVVVFALSHRAVAHLLHARAHGDYARVYVALTPGLTQGGDHLGEGEWSWAIGIDAKDKTKRTVVEGVKANEAKASKTRYRIMTQNQAIALLRLEPITGRTHQLRVHAARAGLPLCGDVDYGGPRRATLANGRIVGFDRVMLHCLSVAFPDIDGVTENKRFVAPVPDDMSNAFSSLGGVWPSLEAFYI